jgi:Glycosyl hydrolase family 26
LGASKLKVAIAALAVIAVAAGIALAVLYTNHPGAVSLPSGKGGGSVPGTHAPGTPGSGSPPASHHPGKKTHPHRGGHTRQPGSGSHGHQGPGGRLVPAHGALFGAWAEPIGGANYYAYERAVLKLEHEIGRKLAVDQLYDPWSRPLPLIVARWDLRNGRIPMISWAGYHTNLIAAGRFDREIMAKARQLRALHGPVMLRWFAEMDGRNDRPLVASPASFIRAWRHVHDIFRRAGATNVSWVWCPNAGHFPDGVSQLYYPGARYVDWICADGYNWAPRRQGAPWKNIATIFSSYYSWGIKMGKPLMIGEFGVLERGPGEKAAWFRQTARQLRTLFPRIKAVIYFNSDHQGYDWRVTTSRSALAGFRAFASDPWFSAKPPHL